MTKSGWAFVVACLVALGPVNGASALDSEALRLMLLSAQDNNTPQTVLRGDVAITVATNKGERTTRAIALFAPGKDGRWYLQLEEPVLAALVLGGEHKVMQRAGGTTETLPIGTTIDDLGVAYEDLSRFVESEYKLWQITDESREKVLVGGHANAPSAYLYRAYTFEKERSLPVKVQFYGGTLNNLIKMRTDAEHVLIGKKLFPGRIDVQNFPENSTTTFRIQWSQAASAPPELLSPESFAGTTPLPWTAPAPAPASSPAPSPK